MLLRSRQHLLVALVAAVVFARCEAFQPNVPTSTTIHVIPSASALKLAASASEGLECSLSRRDVASVFGGGVLALGISPQLALAADEPFRVLFTIQIAPDSVDEVEVEVRPDWAPLAAQRFRELIELGFYKDAPFFRVLPGYVAQFGISSDPKLNKQWVYCDISDEEAKQNCKPSLPDEPRTQANKKGTLSFASSGKNSRKTQIFINLANNDGPPNFLDVQNFVPFAKIVRGTEVAKKLNGEYGGRVNQGKAAYYGREYFQQVFPKLSVIKDIKIL
mmetsp:Transcript_26563/g.76712  ORF Transcript_26563/g.76712 Transcript_26563/m.76712 type:complete len:276 (-) Transcript_26563:82-909(-)